MAKAEHAKHSRVHKSYAKRMSDHIAFALVVYTLALIFVTSPTMESKGTSILPYMMLVIFVAAVIPACRNLERRWTVLEASELSDGGLETRYNIDRAKLWMTAIGVPFLLAFIFTIF